MVINENGEFINNFLSRDVSRYYKFLDTEDLLNNDCVVNFYQKYDMGKVLSSWWKEAEVFQ